MNKRVATYHLDSGREVDVFRIGVDVNKDAYEARDAFLSGPAIRFDTFPTWDQVSAAWDKPENN